MELDRSEFISRFYHLPVVSDLEQVTNSLSVNTFLKISFVKWEQFHFLPAKAVGATDSKEEFF